MPTITQMAEKAQLIPVAEPHSHVHRRCKGRSIGKLLTVSAATALVYYGVPYGMIALNHSRLFA